MLAALALCVTAIAYYVSPTIRHCCRKARRNNKPVSAELVDEFKDL